MSSKMIKEARARHTSPLVKSLLRYSLIRKRMQTLNQIKILTLVAISFALESHSPTKMQLVEASFKRCFTCRSRGPLGDCRDPFTLNSTTFDGQTNLKPSIEAVPCSSGWCSKITEDEYGDSIKATERSCMTRPPTDNEERCSETLFENHRDRKVFLCMCYGDLCNGTSQILPSSLVVAIVCFSIIMTGYLISGHEKIKPS